MRFNDHDLRGQLMVRLTECNGTGTKSKLKRENTHWLLRFEDRKWLRGTSIPGDTITVRKTDEGRFFAKPEDVQG